MNLLEDYREIKEEPVIDDQFSDESSAFLESDETYDTDVQDFHRPTDYSSYNQRKKSLIPILGFVVVVIAVILVLFWGDLWKGERIPSSYFQTTDEPAGEQPQPPAEQTDEQPPGEEPSVLQSAESESVETPPVSQPQGTPRKVPGSAAKPLSTDTAGLTLVADVATLFLQTARSIQVDALILDDYSIEAEISAKSREELETFYTNLQENIPGKLSFAPSPTASTEAKGLLMGILGEPVPTESLLIEQKPARVLEELTTLIDQFDLNLEERSVGKRISKNGFSVNPLYIRCTGSISACNAYLAEISERQFIVKVSKVLLIANYSGSANFVLRFQVINAI